MFYLVQYIFAGIPIAAILFFVISLYRYCYAKKKNKADSNAFGVEEMKKRKLLLIISSLIAGVLVLVVVAFVCLLSLAIVNM